MHPQIKLHLAQDGYVLLPGILPEETVERLNTHLDRLWLEEGYQSGIENYQEPGVRRLANLADKGEIFKEVYANPEVLAAVQAVVGPRVHVSMVNAREIPPQTPARMPFHCDTDGGGKPDARGYYSCTAVCMLTPFTRLNGATRLIPGSHRTHQLPQEVLEDLLVVQPNEVTVEGRPGDVMVFNGHCWHTGGANQTESPRRALLVHYMRADIPLREDRRQRISPQVEATLTTEERLLLALDV